MGGLGDLRKVQGVSKVNSAFDEFFHTPDFRQGRGKTGWHGIPRLGVFLWRLQSFGVGPTTPVESTLCPGQFTFDPTGREIPLFTAAAIGEGDPWSSPADWQLPAPITPTLLQPALSQETATLYSADLDTPNSLGVLQAGAGSGSYELIPASALDGRSDKRAYRDLLRSTCEPSPAALLDRSGTRPAGRAHERPLGQSVGHLPLWVLLDDRRWAL